MRINIQLKILNYLKDRSDEYCMIVLFGIKSEFRVQWVSVKNEVTDRNRDSGAR